MPDLCLWPAALRPRSVAFNRRGQTVAGPVSLANRTQVASYDGGYWVASIDLVTIGLGAAVNAFRAFRSKMEGGAHHVLVPAFDRGQAPWAIPGGPGANENEPGGFDDGTQFTDGTGFYEPSIRVYTSAAASLRASLIVVDITAAGTIVEGMLFSIYGEGLHEIKRILNVNGTERTLAISPPLRKAVGIGRRLDFERPVCRMRLMSEGDSDISIARGMAQPSMNFIEVTWG